MSESPATSANATSPPGVDELRQAVITALSRIYDPEIPVNIYDLGLIYGVEVSDAGAVHVRMTLTSPACPVAGSLPGQVKSAVQAVPGVTAANIELVWDPPWSADQLSEAAKLQLGLP